MIPTTPSGVRTRSMVMPFGRFHFSVTLPTGSFSRATISSPFAIASTRLPSSVSRSRKAGLAPAIFASCRSAALAARISREAVRIAFAIATSALFFCAVGASASARAALRARTPISAITPAILEEAASGEASSRFERGGHDIPVRAGFYHVGMTRASCRPTGPMAYRNGRPPHKSAQAPAGACGFS